MVLGPRVAQVLASRRLAAPPVLALAGVLFVVPGAGWALASPAVAIAQDVTLDLRLAGCAHLPRGELAALLELELAGLRDPPRALRVDCRDVDVEVEALWAEDRARSQVVTPSTDEPLPRVVSLVAGQLARAGPVRPAPSTLLEDPLRARDARAAAPVPTFVVGGDVRAVGYNLDPGLWLFGARVRAGLPLDRAAVLWGAAEVEGARRGLALVRLGALSLGLAIGVSGDAPLTDRLAFRGAAWLAGRVEHLRGVPQTEGGVGGSGVAVVAEPSVEGGLRLRAGPVLLGVDVGVGVALPTPRATFTVAEDAGQLDTGPLRVRGGLSLEMAR